MFGRRIETVEDAQYDVFLVRDGPILAFEPMLNRPHQAVKIVLPNAIRGDGVTAFDLVDPVADVVCIRYSQKSLCEKTLRSDSSDRPISWRLIPSQASRHDV